MDCTVFYLFLDEKAFVSFNKNFSYKELDTSHKENIDLLRVRFVNQIKHIFVRQGHRMYKVFECLKEI